MTQSKTYREKIGDQLREEREYRGLSKSDVSERLSISEERLDQIECGKEQIETDMLKQLTEIYGISARKFIISISDQDSSDQIAIQPRNANDLSEKDKNEIRRFANFLKLRQTNGGES